MGRVWIDPEEVDDLHRQCLEARRWIRQQTNEARRRLGLPPKEFS